jgi:hypothetical protein
MTVATLLTKQRSDGLYLFASGSWTAENARGLEPLIDAVTRPNFPWQIIRNAFCSVAEILNNNDGRHLRAARAPLHSNQPPMTIDAHRTICL